MRRSKYGNKRVQADGKKFDSQKEFRHYLKLKNLAAEGKIYGLTCQVPFHFPVNGEALKYIDSNRKIKYIADFEYFTPEGKRVIEDVKGFKTRDYLIKKALMMSCHGILIEEV